MFFQSKIFKLGSFCVPDLYRKGQYVLQMNKWRIRYLNCEDEDMKTYCTNNLGSDKIKAWKMFLIFNPEVRVYWISSLDKTKDGN